MEDRTDAATQLIFALEKAAPTPPSYVAIAETLKTIGDTKGAKFWASRGLTTLSDGQAVAGALPGLT